MPKQPLSEQLAEQSANQYISQRYTGEDANTPATTTQHRDGGTTATLFKLIQNLIELGENNKKLMPKKPEVQLTNQDMKEITEALQNPSLFTPLDKADFTTITEESPPWGSGFTSLDKTDFSVIQQSCPPCQGLICK
jgi:hypothetical protein